MCKIMFGSQIFTKAEAIAFFEKQLEQARSKPRLAMMIPELEESLEELRNSDCDTVEVW
jgi:hypothetical protein